MSLGKGGLLALRLGNFLERFLYVGLPCSYEYYFVFRQTERFIDSQKSI